MERKAHILIEGIGGTGGIIAARVLQAGYLAALVTSNGQITDAINRDGLKITTPEGSSIVPASAFTTLDDLPADERFDAAYLLMKANGVVDAARRTVPHLTPDGYVVTFQNGIVEDAVGEAIGMERLIGASIGWNSVMKAPGIYEKTSPGETFIGELDGSITPRLQELAQAIQTATPVVVTQNIRGALWAKLAINCALNAFSSISGGQLGDLLKDRRI